MEKLLYHVERVNFQRFHHQSAIKNIAFHRNHFRMGKFMQQWKKGAEVTRDKMLRGRSALERQTEKFKFRLFLYSEVLNNESLTDGGF